MTIVLEHELGGVDALVAELLELAAHLKAIAFFGDEQAHAFVARLRIGIGLDQQREAWPWMPLEIQVLVPLTT